MKLVIQGTGKKIKALANRLKHEAKRLNLTFTSIPDAAVKSKKDTDAIEAIKGKVKAKEAKKPKA